jgi:hypothetical protein
MVSMKQLLLFTLWAIALEGGELSAVHAVYLLPMGSGLDQYLANRLASEHIFRVVTDPKLADAVFTDRIGNAFEEKLADLTAPPPAKPAPGQAAANQAAGNQAGPNQAAGNQTAGNQTGPNQTVPPALAAFAGETANKLSDPAANSSFGRGKGTIFLVNVKSKQVIWSVFERPKTDTSAQLDRSASDIVSHLKRDLKKTEASNHE